MFLPVEHILSFTCAHITQEHLLWVSDCPGRGVSCYLCVYTSRQEVLWLTGNHKPRFYVTPEGDFWNKFFADNFVQVLTLKLGLEGVSEAL